LTATILAMRRLTPLANAFSKKVENRAAAIASTSSTRIAG